MFTLYEGKCYFTQTDMCTWKSQEIKTLFFFFLMQLWCSPSTNVIVSNSLQVLLNPDEIKCNTVGPWTTWAWNTQAYLYMDIFNSNTTVIQLVESKDSELWKWRTAYKLYLDFWLSGVSALLTSLSKDQLY